MDRLEVNVMMPLAATESITGFSAIFYHDVELYSEAKYVFDTMTYIHHESSTPLSKVDIDGDLILRQTWPLSAKGG